MAVYEVHELSRTATCPVCDEPITAKTVEQDGLTRVVRNLPCEDVVEVVVRR
jgi:hypothetical protein